MDDDISVAGANANGALGDGYLKFSDLSRFLKLPKDSLNLRAGQFELDLPFSQALHLEPERLGHFQLEEPMWGCRTDLARHKT